MNSTVDIIIPTYKPDRSFLELIKALKNQTKKINKIIIINTEKKYWDNINIEKDIKELLRDNINFKLIHIKKEEFDHGASRNLAIKASTSDYFICMTMDALPYNEYLVENLIMPMSDSIKLTYARQVAKKDADIIENFTRLFNYPEYDILKGKEDLSKMGIKTYFVSNVCACYERKTFDELMKFDENIILNEDMLYAYKLISADKYIKYSSSAIVYHSHKYTAFMQLKRNFDIGVSHIDNKYIFSKLRSSKEGVKLVKSTFIHLIKTRRFIDILKLIYISLYKFIGFKLGKSYKLLPKKFILVLSMNKEYWRAKSV